MGAFTQGLTSAIGQAGEDAATGANANTLQQHNFLMDYLANQARSRGLDIAQQQTNQTGAQDIFQRQYLTGQQTIEQQRANTESASAYKSLGWTYNPATQGYEELMYNPVTNDTKHIPGQPPADSPEGQQMMLNKLMGFKDANGQPLLLPSEAKAAVFKLSASTDPALKYEVYDELGQKAFPNDPTKAAARSAMLRDQDEKDRLREMYGANGVFNTPGAGGKSIIDTYTDAVGLGPGQPGGMLLSAVPKEMQPAIMQGLSARGQALPKQLSADAAQKLSASSVVIADALNNVKKVQGEIGQAGNSLAHDALVDILKQPDKDSILKLFTGRLLQLNQSPADRIKSVQLAADLTSLSNNLKTLQIPMGVSGYRGQAEWEKSKGDLINALNPTGINKDLLNNIQSQLQSLYDNTQEALKGDIVPGQATGGNNNPPAATGGGFAAFKSSQQGK